ncbi:VOC family protein [Flavobacterium subsaxonicum]|uniref:Transposase n=1 Tax=Flavobacterium subsaxonicum WB 4.1-42 = DSM 21790 TaxID=1121898 RepID=A0A0A2MXZ8_9FLAO|nr:VOC family protein [Flavobacterium subsaxonicum]KGO93090.1 transposase [Flavobacterium subsaxonicum WB 4.1-42 = DSM 21790]
MNIPANYLPVMPYLVLDNAPEFLTYAKKVFGAVEQLILPGEKERIIMHGELKIGDAVIMFAQSNDNWKQKPAGMFIYVESVDRVYNAGIEQGGTSLQPPAKQEYGYAAGFEDPFGNQWWVNQPE